MLDYLNFQFAAAPFTGVEWFSKACLMAGYGPVIGNPQEPFPEQESHPIRVSLVRHPCDWLYSLWAAASRGEFWEVGDFTHGVLSGNFDAFLAHYLSVTPGAVGRLFMGYRADSYMRIEDMPMALAELLCSIDAPDHSYRDPFFRSPIDLGPCLPVGAWDKRLRQAVCDAERELMSEFDYF